MGIELRCEFGHMIMLSEKHLIGSKCVSHKCKGRYFRPAATTIELRCTVCGEVNVDPANANTPCYRLGCAGTLLRVQ